MRCLQNEGIQGTMIGKLLCSKQRNCDRIRSRAASATRNPMWQRRDRSEVTEIIDHRHIDLPVGPAPKLR